MAEATGLRNNALPYPIYGLPFGVVFPLLDADGDPVSPSSPDSEVSKNGDTFADCTNEATEIATSSGVCYLLLTGTEMTADVVAVRAQSTGAKTTVITLYPRKLVTVRTGTSASGGVSTSTIVLDGSASAVDDYYNGMVVAAVIDGTTEVRMISDYTGSNQTATVVPDWNTAPDNNDTFTIYLPDGVQIQQANVSHWNSLATVALPLTPTTAGRALDVTAGGCAGIDWDNVEAPTATVGLSGTTVKTATDVETDTADIQSRLPAALVSGRMDSSVGAMAANVVTAAAIADGAIDAATFAADVDAEVLSYLVDDATRIDASALNTLSSHDPGEAIMGATDLGTGSGLTALATAAELAKVPKSDGSVTWNATALASIQSEANDALVAQRLDELLNADSDINGAAPPTVGSVFHELMSKTAGSFTFDQTTDSLEALRDRGDAAWVTATSVTVSDKTGFKLASDGLALVTAWTVDVTGTITTVTNLTNLPAITANWLTAAGTAADFGTEVGAAVLSALGTGTWASAIPWNASWDAEVQSEVQDAIEANNLDHLVKIAVDTDFATTVHLDSVVGQLAQTADGGYSRATDSLEAVRDRGDLAWITAVGFSTLDAAGVRSAVGLGSANLDTQLSTIDGVVDAILADTGTDGVALASATQQAIATSLLDLSNGVESGVTMRQALRAVGAILSGIISGAGTGTEVFKGLGQASNGTTRVTVTVDSSGNRSALTLNL